MSENTVLFVDDEVSVLRAIKRAVMDEKFVSFFANSGEEALTVLGKNKIDVIVTDMRMPGMDGLKLLKIVKEKYPKTVRVVLSGYTQLSQMLVTINQGEIFKFITKPWTTENELLPVIKQSIDYYNLQTERDSLNEKLTAKNAAYQRIFKTIEDKKIQEREELRHLYKISVLLFSLLRRNIGSKDIIEQDNNKEQSKIFHMAEVIYLTYLGHLPAVVDSKPLAKLIDDIVTNCDNRISIESVEGETFNTKGNHKYLTIVFKILIHILPHKRETFNCRLSQNKQEDEMIRSVFSIDLSSCQFSIHDENQIKIAAALLSKIGAFYDINVAAEYAEQKLNQIYVEWITEKN
ncbi:response regulator [Pectinatus frisingensis]|uniref:response regulator n=1 Tax=Pectinatus frisingensis TaxID=865 RepID=UPI0018C5073B|nr:response regulator [Pectinatus frisingensis]